jgi:hypothetical protein
MKETVQEKTLRHLKRRPLNEVRNHYFNTDWTSYKDLKDYFKESGWTRGELVAADKPSGRGEERWDQRILYWFLQGFPNYYEPIPPNEIQDFEVKLKTNTPCIVRTVHGNYESDILYNPTFKQLLKCVRESIYVNKDPDHRGIGCLPYIETYHDGGINSDITYHVITFSMDS